ncbi:MAG: MFS transporter, partial [Planctomycetaceae bacterium]|nr:MFS transporter [Planctomycetaceae bacterium]
MKPTSVRYQVVGVTTLVAVLMYLDRVCISEIAKLDSFVTALSLNDTQKGAILAAFFYTYAFAQVPAGWLADRLGARMMLTLYVGIWSLCTLMTGMANGFLMLISARLLFGVAQAGCYPTASSLNKRWIPARQRGTTSSIISFGGRLGGTIAPLLTAWLLKEYLGWRDVLVWYGLIGFAIAFVFWWVCRDTPRRHPQ